MSDTDAKDSDVEIISPPNALKDKVPSTGKGEPDYGVVERAEKALGTMSVEFDDWLADEVEKLLSARAAVLAEGLSDATVENLYKASHDLKGTGETYGYPLISQVCTSLCTLLDSVPHPRAVPDGIIDHHVNAVRNMMKLEMKGPDDPQGSAVADKLLEVVLEYADYEEKKKKMLDEENPTKDAVT